MGDSNAEDFQDAVARSQEGQLMTQSVAPMVYPTQATAGSVVAPESIERSLGVLSQASETGNSADLETANSAELLDLMSQSSGVFPAHRVEVDSNLETLRVLITVIQTEASFPELLPSWTADPLTLSRELPPQGLSRLMASWQSTGDLVKSTVSR